ncbi:TraX protein [Lachnospiraceae bacterium XBD2001]|nr:TraX protein [Lachnospiraceae bacterium XBD2001]
MKLNRNQTKYILILAMLIDHIAWAFVPTASLLGQVMHVIGRLTGPSMAVLLAEGYQYTKDKKKYAIRLFLFALISWIPFDLFESGRWPGFEQGVIYSLFLAFLVIWMWDQLQIHKAFKIMLVVLACFLSVFGDWAFFVILWALFAYIYRENPKAKWISFGIIATVEVGILLGLSAAFTPTNAWENVKPQLFQLGVVLVPIFLIFFYNGEKGSKHPIHKWFFYVFYPAHLLVLYLLKQVLGY